MQNIRIAVFGLNEGVGGIETYLRNLQKMLHSNKSIKFDFILWHEQKALPYEDEMKERGARFYRELYRVKEYYRSDAIPIWNLFNIHTEWDGIYINVSRIEYSYLLLFEAARRGLPYRILHSHSSYQAYRAPINKVVWKFVYWATNRWTITQRLACSTIAGENMFGKAAYKVIPNAIDFNKFNFDSVCREQVRSQLQILSDDIVIGFCGRFCYDKNLEKILEIFYFIQKQISNCKLLLVGDGEMREHVKILAENYGFFSKLILVGEQLDTSSYYQAMDCFLMPSHHEGLGIALLEAQASGLICYAAEGSVPSEVNITNRVVFLSNSLPSKYWADTIIQNGFERMDCMKELLSSNYSLNSMKEAFVQTVFGDLCE